ncbi:MAG TPA: DUF6152 family protein [Vicinamibacterales bacterium]|nr:DUF6152 family protein [Vicinamibacterales bacterium]
MARWILSSLLGLSLCGVSVGAHHSIAAVYDSTKRVKVEGVVTRFQFTNPHPLLMIDVSDASGAVREWRLEMDNRSELAGVGVTTATFKAGDRVVVTGSLAREQANGLYIQRLDRPSDGFWYEQVGGSPRIRGTRDR